MIVHFIRHAQAIKRSTSIADEHRFLSCRGRKRFRRVATTLRKLNIDPTYIFSSPKIRAVQTADILAEKLLFTGDVIITPILLDFTMQSLADLLQLYPLPVEIAIVGHDPDFSDVVSQLLNISCSLTKGCVVTLDISNGLSKPTKIIQFITGGGKHFSTWNKVINRLQTKTVFPEEEQIS